MEIINFMKTTNFSFLEKHDPLLVQLARTAEKAFVPDPNTTLLKLRQLGEAIAQDIASHLGIEFNERTTQLDLLRNIQDEVNLHREITDTFHAIRKIGNEANHEFTSNHREAIQVLKLSWKLSIWYHSTFGSPTKGWKPGAFKTPEDPSVEVRALEERIAILEKAKLASQRELNVAQQLSEAEKQKAIELEKFAQSIKEDSDTWQTIAQDQEEALASAKKKFEQQAHQQQAQAQLQTPNAKAQREKIKSAITKSIWQESEAETRLRIDQQLRDAGWQADTENYKHSKGTRPRPGQNIAIAEWPTASGPADYVLFIGLKAYAVVEAKKASKNVAADIDQAERYSQTIKPSKEFDMVNGQWPASDLDPAKGAYNIPFLFATNGNPYLTQHREKSGVWFRDCRRPQNQRKPNDGWYSPEGLEKLFKQDINAAEKRLANQNFNFDFQLRDYQIKAIKAAEQGIADGLEKILLAMATGTGKTKTCIALIYRLLDAQRFRRILFLVDRSALGEQTADAFESTHMVNQQTFADSFNIKGLKDATVDSDTEVHVATVQGMVKRVLYSDNAPTVDQYDCIVVDECHRGYLLDRELNDTELQFRSEKDYISKYSRVIDYFDAVKIGLTATPALHTSEIFGDPVYTYTYREAVIDGYLIDHEPPIQIKTQHNQHGINYKIGEKIAVYDANTQQVDYAQIDDELNFDISHINRTVVDESFNKTVCHFLAEQIDPFAEDKMLIFCVTDSHADQVVECLKNAITEVHGECEDGLVKKITGASDKPLEQIRRYKNDRLPKVAVTVDLLTTGIDVPHICDLVFLRPVKSRILYEQMKGRATRQCPEINKEVYRIYDAVNLYDNLEPLTNMKPVVVNPKITYAQLQQEITSSLASANENSDDGAEPVKQNAPDSGNQRVDSTPLDTDTPIPKISDLQAQARDQFVAKLQRKKRSMSNDAKQQFEILAGQSPEDFINHIKNLPVKDVAEWFTNHPGLGELLDEKAQTKPPLIFISEKEDAFIEAADNYGKTITAADYLDEFTDFIKNHENDMIALKTIIHQPGKVTRAQIKELLLALDSEQFTEKNLRRAWQMETKKDIGARIVGYIRKAALGDALIPWEQRVDNAINVILTQQNWKPVQKNILRQVGSLMKERLALDEESINQSALRRKYGPFSNINKQFNNELPKVLESINDALWQQQA
jgi:type I restriction enzyme R subunit